MNDSAATAPEFNYDDDELVAYLDGELDADHARRVEQLLASEPAARQRLRELQASWDFLDNIPRPEVNNEFTQTTVSMIALQEAKSIAIDTKPLVRRFSSWMLPMAGAVMAGVLGYALVHAVYTSPERKLLQDLPVIENMDMYQAAESVEFLRTMKREGLFNEELSNDF